MNGKRLYPAIELQDKDSQTTLCNGFEWNILKLRLKFVNDASQIFSQISFLRATPFLPSLGEKFDQTF